VLVRGRSHGWWWWWWWWWWCTALVHFGHRHDSFPPRSWERPSLGFSPCRALRREPLTIISVRCATDGQRGLPWSRHCLRWSDLDAPAKSGRLDEAESATSQLHDGSRTLDHPFALATQGEVETRQSFGNARCGWASTCPGRARHRRRAGPDGRQAVDLPGRARRHPVEPAQAMAGTAHRSARIRIGGRVRGSAGSRALVEGRRPVRSCRSKRLIILLDRLGVAAPTVLLSAIVGSAYCRGS
jgi:hypothetical protein